MYLAANAALAAVCLMAVAVVSLQHESSPLVTEDLYFNRRALEEQVAESTPAIPGDYFDSRNLKETDPAAVSGAGSVYGRPPELEQERPTKTELEQEQTTELTPAGGYDSLAGMEEGAPELEQEEGTPELEQEVPSMAQLKSMEDGEKLEQAAPTSELAIEPPSQQRKRSNLRKEVSKLAKGQDAIQKELKTLETVLVTNAKQKQMQAAPAPVSLEEDDDESSAEEDAEPSVHHSSLPELAMAKTSSSDDSKQAAVAKPEAHQLSTAGRLQYGQKILIRTHHGHFVASKSSGSVLTISHKHTAAQFTILNYDDPTDKSPVRFGDVVGLKDGHSNYLAGDVDGRLEATAKSLSRQDAFVLTDPHNHDDVAHVKNTQPISLFSVHFGKFMAVDGDEELMVHGDSDNSNAQFAMLAQ